LKRDKSEDLSKYRDEISEMLKAEILVRYYYAAGRLEGSLVTDPEVLKACEVLHDKELYNKTLKR
ncbi:MAG: peptidase S41, partial [Bacteroidales bacterium]|nr:peptidase S41 [Bacteroidales bacterium]